MLIPRQTVSALIVETLEHGRFDLFTQASERFTLLVFYRRLHCSICTRYLTELERLVPEFEKPGVHVIALSSDDK